MVSVSRRIVRIMREVARLPGKKSTHSLPLYALHSFPAYGGIAHQHSFQVPQ